MYALLPVGSLQLIVVIIMMCLYSLANFRLFNQTWSALIPHLMVQSPKTKLTIRLVSEDPCIIAELKRLIYGKTYLWYGTSTTSPSFLFKYVWIAKKISMLANLQQPAATLLFGLLWSARRKLTLILLSTFK